MGNGMRQICLLLIPSAVLMAVLAEPITRLVYQRGEFDAEATELVKTALVWWSISLPFQGVSLLFTRTFFSLQQPWATTALSVLNLVVNAVVAAALYEPFGIAGIVLGTVAGTVAMCVAQGWILRRRAGRHRRGAHRPHDRAAGDRRRACSALRRLRGLVRARRGARPVADRPGDLGARRHRRRARRSTAPRCGCCACPRRARSRPCCCRDAGSSPARSIAILRAT